MLPEEEFLTKDEAVVAQARYKSETADLALGQRDEAAQTTEEFQADIDRLLKLEIEVRAELAKLQGLGADPPSPGTLVVDARETMKTVGEQSIMDFFVSSKAPEKEKQEKGKVTTLLRAIGAHFYEAVIISPRFEQIFYPTSETVRVEKGFDKNDFRQNID
ncbi:hypothetical protein IscW_ISCW019213 [Ixodes scapularis]|uniref:Uncharacterized protein n=1 Tax=Ixodes scapularis TaxID=6945 RepID=B7PR24_IXOSC|nr:hypothetical protein IscW_ISCW019213 [Ixodes scapularis]|eukprot:XP_002436216.1 hypothetical protein IscW_ISCW019213 [Ixodes scapularis]